MFGEYTLLMVAHDDPLIAGRRVLIQPNLFHPEERIMVPMTAQDIRDLATCLFSEGPLSVTREDALDDLLHDYLTTLEGTTK